jgi:hypothetical protein
MCIDLNALMPFYAARLGGVDARCPELPGALRTALYAGSACVVSPSTTAPAVAATEPTLDQPSTIASSAPPVAVVAVTAPFEGVLPATS